MGSANPIVLTKLQQTPGTDSTYPKIQIWKDFLHKQAIEGLGYVPAACWSFLRIIPLRLLQARHTTMFWNTSDLVCSVAPIFSEDHSFASPNLEFSTQIPQGSEWKKCSNTAKVIHQQLSGWFRAGCVLQIVGPHDSGTAAVATKSIDICLTKSGKLVMVETCCKTVLIGEFFLQAWHMTYVLHNICISNWLAGFRKSIVCLWFSLFPWQGKGQLLKKICGPGAAENVLCLGVLMACNKQVLQLAVPKGFLFSSTTQGNPDLWRNMLELTRCFQGFPHIFLLCKSRTNLGYDWGKDILFPFSIGCMNAWIGWWVIELPMLWPS